MILKLIIFTLFDQSIGGIHAFIDKSNFSLNFSIFLFASSL